MRTSRIAVTCLIVSCLVLPCTAQQESNSTDKINALNATLEKDPDNRDKVVELANLYYDTNEWPQAEKWYKRSLELNDRDANVLTDLGTTQRHLGQSAEALASFDQALAVDPTHWQALYNKCVVLIYDVARPADAVESLDALESMRNDHPEIPDLATLRAATRDSPAAGSGSVSPELEQAARQFVKYQVPDDFLEELYQQAANSSAVAIENSVQPKIGRAVTDSERSRLLILCYNFMKEAMPLSVLQDILWPVVARHFSLDDLTAINGFLATPTGQKLMSAQAVIMREGQSAGEQLGKRLADDAWGRRLQAELKQQFPQWFPNESANPGDSPKADSPPNP